MVWRQNWLSLQSSRPFQGVRKLPVRRTHVPLSSLQLLFHRAVSHHLGPRSRTDTTSSCLLLRSPRVGNPKELCTRNTQFVHVTSFLGTAAFLDANKFTKLFVTSKLLSVTLEQCMWKMHGRCQECCIVFNYYIKHLLLPFMDQIAFYS